MQLQHLGWNAHWDAAFASWRAAGLEPARVTVQHNHLYRAECTRGNLLAEVAGKLRHAAVTTSDLPAVGDWVAIAAAGERAVIEAVLPRHSHFSRKAPGRANEEQVVAANVDTVFLLAGLDNDYSPRRVERYLATAWESGATPVVVLNKADLCADVAARLAEIGEIAIGVAVHAVSALRGEGLDALAPYLRAGETVALLGSSGVGKSTLINRLLGAEVLATQAVRERDSRGRHTTTHRQMLVLPRGGVLIDTPGMRELQLWDADEALHVTFDEIETLAADCRFSDCSHQQEPGCAVQQAIARGELAADRLGSYHKLQKELAFLNRRQDKLAELEHKRRWKVIHKAAREFYRD